MPKVPTHIKDYISNADYHLGAELALPRREFAATHILSLLTAWENIKIAEEELHHWVWKTPVAKALHKSHAYKFRDIRKSKSIDRIILGKPGTKAKTISYSTDKEFEKLIELCRYGTSGGSKALKSIFEKGWHFDDFRNALITKIRWEKMMVEIYENLEKTQK